MIGNFSAKADEYYMYDNKDERKIEVGDKINTLTYLSAEDGLAARKIENCTVLDITNRQISLENEDGVKDIEIRLINDIEGLTKEEEIEYE